jgi:hypothetical protein
MHDIDDDELDNNRLLAAGLRNAAGTLRSRSGVLLPLTPEADDDDDDEGPDKDGRGAYGLV